MQGCLCWPPTLSGSLVIHQLLYLLLHRRDRPLRVGDKSSQRWRPLVIGGAAGRSPHSGPRGLPPLLQLCLALPGFFPQSASRCSYFLGEELELFP
ncbi:UNVERIFIED_CONTAM: hypothetical protein FKN15_056407 [Acipenser sinensis]